jgi:hypothetical protein
MPTCLRSPSDAYREFDGVIYCALHEREDTRKQRELSFQTISILFRTIFRWLALPH